MGTIKKPAKMCVECKYSELWTDVVTGEIYDGMCRHPNNEHNKTLHIRRGWNGACCNGQFWEEDIDANSRDCE